MCQSQLKIKSFMIPTFDVGMRCVLVDKSLMEENPPLHDGVEHLLSHADVVVADVLFCAPIVFTLLTSKATMWYCQVSHHRIPRPVANGNGFGCWKP